MAYHVHRFTRLGARVLITGHWYEPHRQIAALAQTRFVGWPIRQPALLLRDVVATLGVGLEGHGGHPGAEIERALYPVQPWQQTWDLYNAA
jgi:hypothetical protein